MSLPVFQATIVNDSGDIIPSAVITVLDEITGLGLTIYSDRAGTVPLGTSGVFTAGTDGFAQFFAPAGNYRVKAEQAASGFEKTWDFVPLVGGAAFVDLGYFGTAATANVQTSPTDTTAGALMAVGAAGAISLSSGANNDANVAEYPDGFGVRFILGGTNLPPGFVNGIVIEYGSTVTSNTPQDFIDHVTGSKYTRGTVGSAWQPAYTGANYQPETLDGIGTTKLLYATTGNIADGNTVTGDLVSYAFVGASGAYSISSALSSSQLWVNVGGGTATSTGPKLFTRKS